MTYKVTSTRTELPPGAQFTVKNPIIPAGSLCLFQVGKFHTIGRWIPDVAGCDWIIQPARWIRIAGGAIVKIVGTVAPLVIWSL